MRGHEHGRKGARGWARWLAAAALALAGAGAPADTPSADTPREAASRIWLWPQQVAPGSRRLRLQQRILERSADPRLPDRIVTGVTRPYLTVHRPARPNGAALLVAPGGGYRRIVLDKEGSALVPALAEAHGYTLFVLRYRLPGDGHDDGRDAPLADAQRALRLIRARAGEFGLDPQRIGAIGFSAGGHVAASLGTRYDERVYAPVDAADRLSARPDFLLLLYPVIDMGGHAHPGSRERLLGAAPSAADVAAHSLQHRVRAGMPPVFLLHAADDATVPVENSLQLYAALRRAGVPAELHVYPRGGHGFGVRQIADSPLRLWPALAAAWIEAQGRATERQAR
ncbi:alpha/beta hydrolase [Vulcaniibacterium tengchongense]|uniref:Acetyl esterase/lipase n=1 Tax=Vulcaniibacterium tengchongense TaxID=1273429 RepID=A0A3N4UYX0_9GAMM|nr:alpha/beta hydrolase [Vulcaniibacterium tengchongense]RPE75922.1 acetyl esterase/lipase [Vulcaniibacterium tengchongense]